ncbi:GEVED domain-containing protein [Flavobacterium terrigena]|uniref:Por secretion system C-terminal sorting domain-containing protein n=1 Tax=Flavobacterium terrigena TaxID=402734 RepID=A0A1H6UUP8_9FLAO|nr:GEVED domain-containing protein [Flavobacterium terrigena]SEI95386.1 Por secretion system C-terminal sorting domain-containing protein [Flavobacterium terrigena]
MKKITLWLFALFTCWQISAQTGTIVVGVNDGTPNTAISNPSPMQDYYKTGRVQFLYTASELLGVGLVAGNITEIGWVVTSNNASTLQEGYTISMKSTSSTVLTANFESGSTVVYGPTDFTPSTTGNVMFTLTTPFVWDGTSNVIVEVCAGSSSGTYTQNVSCANSTTTGTQAVFFRSDSSTSPCTEVTGTALNDRPLLVATGNVASCLAPLNLVSANVTAFTADISWDATSSTPLIGYEYVVSTSNVAPTGAGTATTNVYASVSSLLPTTTYYVFVRSNCAAGEFSGWYGPISFTTGCVSVANFNQNFDGVTTPALPSCWSKILSGTGISIYASVGTATTNTSAPNGVDLYNSDSGSACNIMLVSPTLSNLSDGTHRLKFKARNTTETQDLEIGVLTDPADANSFTLVQAVDITNSFQSYIVNFDTFTGPGSVIAIKRLSSSTYSNVYLDDIIWEAIPSCPDQTGLTVSNITSTGANTSWDPVAAGVEYAITTSATPPVSGTATTATFYIASGLAPQTLHYLHVRTDCGAGSYGIWVTIPFTTACSPIANFNENFDSVTTPTLPGCWSKLLSGATLSTYASVNTSTVYASAPNGVDLYNSNSGASDNIMLVTPLLSNLSAGTHRLKFKALNNVDTQDLEIGVLTDPADASTFTLVQAVDITTTYQSYIVNFDTFSGPGAAIALKRLSTSTYSNVYLDDVVWEAIPTCPDQTGLVVSNITSSGANTSWDAVAAGVEYAITTSATPPASGTPTTATFYMASGLAPQTVHYLHVRTDCGAGSYGIWVTIPFTTACSPIATLPWIENFDAVTTPAIPQCWSEENGDYSTSNSTSSNTPHSGANYLRDAWLATNEFMWTPGFDLVADTSYDFSSWIQGDGGANWVVDYFVNSVQNSTGATQLGTAYNVPGTGTFGIQPYTKVIRTFVPATTGTYYFAVRVNQPGYPIYIAFDDFELKLSPASAPACTTNLVATPNATCGNFSNNLTWDYESTAAGYYVTIGSTSGGTDIANAVNVGLNSYSFSGSIGTTYFWKVVPYNAAGSATGCTEQSFTTAATGCYCTSSPISNDNLGITTAVIGSTTNNIADVTYADLTAVPEIISQGENTNVQLTFSTGYTYDVNVWIDFNNDYDFDDAGELVKTGIACTIDQPNTVDASFIMPMTAPTGIHRMRIGSADSGQNPPNSCYSGYYGITLDFTVDTVLSSNSFDTTSFVAYPNPVKDVLNLSYKNSISNVRVINLLGQEVLNTKTNANDVQVNMSALTAGAYIVNITVEDTVHTIKVIKE